MKIAVIIPAYNEESHIENVVKGIKNVSIVDAVYVIDDGSTDKTAEIAQNIGVIVIKHEKNMGVGASIRDGFIRAKTDGADIIAVMGGDDQDPPEQIPRVVKPIIEGGYDLVQGSRWLKGGEVKNIPLFRRVTTKAYGVFIRLFTGFPFTDGTNGFRAVRSSFLDKINLNQEWLDHYELEPYLLCEAVRIDRSKVKETPVTKRYFKEKGYTKMVPLRDWWRISKPVIYLRLGIKK